MFVDFRYMGVRCRETTNLTDTPANRKKLEKIIEKMEAEIQLGSFAYEKYFPSSKRLAEFKGLEAIKAQNIEHLPYKIIGANNNILLTNPVNLRT